MGQSEMRTHQIEQKLENPKPAKEQSDEVLVRAAKEDVEAAGRLFDKYYKKISNYIYHSTFDKQLTEDLTSDVFLAAFENLGRFQWRRVPFSAWLFRIASNELAMHFRGRKRLKLVPIDGDIGSKESLAKDMADAEDFRALYAAIEQLDAKYRIVIALRFFEDKTIFEISEILGKPVGTVKSQLHRGLAKLERILVRRGVLPRSEEIQK